MSEERELLVRAYVVMEEFTLGFDDLLGDIKKELEKPNQEPIAWLYDFTIEGETITGWTTTDLDSISNPENGYHNIRPLYLSPQQQNPLSYEEICNVYLAATGQSVRAQDVNLILAFASALEKHHNITNKE